jgi:hypothetical protein
LYAHSLETGLFFYTDLLFSLVYCWLAEELWAWSRKAVLLMQVFSLWGRLRSGDGKKREVGER